MLSLAPLSYTATCCKALIKPTEQPVEQWYASLVGKVPTKYLSKGCGYGFQKRRESTLCVAAENMDTPTRHAERLRQPGTVAN
jgi:hypothetical protein